MSVWGIGAMWNSEEDVSKDFVGYSTAAIGWDEDYNSTFHEKMRKVKVGDLIFIKAKFMEKGWMDIKAIGIIKDATLSRENGLREHEGVKVCWIKNLTDNPTRINSKPEANSTHTFYEVTNEDVIRQVVNLL